jgi:hypothetical protein
LWDISYTHVPRAADLRTSPIPQTLCVRPHTNAPSKARPTWSSNNLTVTLQRLLGHNSPGSKPFSTGCRTIPCSNTSHSFNYNLKSRSLDRSAPHSVIKGLSGISWRALIRQTKSMHGQGTLAFTWIPSPINCRGRLAFQLSLRAGCDTIRLDIWLSHR